MKSCPANKGEEMAEEVEKEKKKVYVETTVVSDATALPTNDIVLMGRQITTAIGGMLQHKGLICIHLLL